LAQKGEVSRGDKGGSAKTNKKREQCWLPRGHSSRHWETGEKKTRREKGGGVGGEKKNVRQTMKIFRWRI